MDETGKAKIPLAKEGTSNPNIPINHRRVASGQLKPAIKVVFSF